MKSKLSIKKNSLWVINLNSIALTTLLIKKIFYLIKKMQTYKPDSVNNKLMPYHLSNLAITHKLHLSTLRQRTSNP